MSTYARCAGAFGALSSYADMTVAELRPELAGRGLAPAKDAFKADLISQLETCDAEATSA